MLATWLMLVLLALPALVACGGGDDGDDPTPTATSGATLASPTGADGAPGTATSAPAGASPSATAATTTPAATTTGPAATATGADPTSTPMPQPQPQLTATATATTASGAADATATPTAASEPRPTEVPEDPTLDGYLVNLDDLGPGWVEVEDVDDTDDTDNTICDAESLEERFEPQARARASHEGEILGPFLEQRIARFADEDEAAAVLDAMRDAISCSSWTDDSDPAAPVEWTVQDLEIAPVGDDYDARRVFAVTDEFELIGDLVFVRKGAYVYYVFLIDLGSVETAITEEIVGTIAGRIP